MNRVTLMSDGSMAENQRTVEKNPLGFLGFGIRLEEGYTLRSYFQMVATYPVLTELNVFIPGYLEQFRRCSATECRCDDFDHLAFCKTVEMIGYPGEPRLEIYHSLQQISGSESQRLRSSRLETLLDMPLKLGNLKHVVFGDQVDVFEFETVFNLFEFVDGTAWELSFHGTPQACDIRR